MINQGHLHSTPALFFIVGHHLHGRCLKEGPSTSPNIQNDVKDKQGYEHHDPRKQSGQPLQELLSLG